MNGVVVSMEGSNVLDLFASKVDGHRWDGS